MSGHGTHCDADCIFPIPAPLPAVPPEAFQRDGDVKADLEARDGAEERVADPDRQVQPHGSSRPCGPLRASMAVQSGSEALLTGVCLTTASERARRDGRRALAAAVQRLYGSRTAGVVQAMHSSSVRWRGQDRSCSSATRTERFLIIITSPSRVRVVGRGTLARRRTTWIECVQLPEFRYE